MFSYAEYVINDVNKQEVRHTKLAETIEVVAIDSSNVLDRIKLCWGHLDNWRNQAIVKKSKEWLEKTNSLFTPTTFIACKSGIPVGFIEFVPQKMLERLGLCPCRVDKENRETENRYILGKAFENYLFISCFFVSKEHQGRGIGTFLLNYFLNSNVFRNSDGATVYASQRNMNWENYVHWPAGPKEFYLKAGFIIEKTLSNPTGYLLSYRNTSVEH